MPAASGFHYFAVQLNREEFLCTSWSKNRLLTHNLEARQARFGRADTWGINSSLLAELTARVTDGLAPNIRL